MRRREVQQRSMTQLQLEGCCYWSWSVSGGQWRIHKAHFHCRVIDIYIWKRYKTKLLLRLGRLWVGVKTMLVGSQAQRLKNKNHGSEIVVKEFGDTVNLVDNTVASEHKGLNPEQTKGLCGIWILRYTVFVLSVCGKKSLKSMTFSTDFVGFFFPFFFSKHYMRELHFWTSLVDMIWFHIQRIMSHNIKMIPVKLRIRPMPGNKGILCFYIIKTPFPCSLWKHVYARTRQQHSGMRFFRQADRLHGERQVEVMCACSSG